MNPFLPMDQNILEISLSEFSHLSKILSGVIGVVILIRFILLSIQVASAEAYGLVLRDVLVYFLAVSLFPILLRVFMNLTAQVALSISFDTTERKPGALAEYFKTWSDKAPFISVLIDLGGLTVLHIARSIYSVLISILIAIGPVVILFSSVVFSGAIKPYFLAICALSLWPITWNLLGLLAQKTSHAQGSTSIAQMAYWVVVEILQLLSPVFSLFLIKNLASGEVARRPLAAFTKVRSFTKNSSKPTEWMNK